ncbi:hypothetical protein N431DRAFT_455310 [Stipitochalara longipes BDJ]|nr:hypothetical protein N431DRAFT_455310 [Stipitochalara longipes BDJ]
MSSDESSELSSVPSDDDNTLQLTKKDGILKFFSKAPPTSASKAKEASPPRPKRDPSPPHEYVLADNPDIAFIVMFRSRFTEAFPKSLYNFGPQELERDIVDTVPGEGAEHFLCALLGLLLNRKQDVKAGHYNRALEEAVQSHKSQWAKDWESKNPLSGGGTFTTMTPTQRLTLLRTLILWSLSSSDTVKGIIQASYKQSRHEDDLNQPLSVQPWGSDGDKRRYYLIEGLDDTHFRIYRESNHTAIKRTWWSVASDIDELKTLADKLSNEDGGQKARLLSQKIRVAIPRFESTEEKRKRREYRQVRKNQFKRPEPNYSMYEGRTRGKRMKYTYSDEEDDIYSDSTTARRSTRNTGSHTPAENTGPTITQSGRQVKSRHGGAYGETILSETHAHAVTAGGLDGTSEEPEGDGSSGRPRRAAAAAATNGWATKGGRHIEGYNDVDEMTSDEEGDASEQDYGDDEEDDHVSLESDVDDPDDLTDENEDLDEAGEKKKLIVKLQVKTPTPEKITTAKLQLTPERDPAKSSALFPSTTSNENASTSTLTAAVSGASSTAIDTKENAKPADITNTSTKPMSVPPKSPSHQSQAAPLSPLAFRGSPEKLPAFPPSVDVGVRGT